MTTLDSRPTGFGPADIEQSEHRLQRELASAYAERLSCLRCDASDTELDENARLIADLESRYRGARTSAALGALLEDPADYLG